MGRALLAISGSAVALLPRPFAHVIHALAALWMDINREPYRPELHYMRGPGPAWRAKHGGKA